MRKNSRLSMRSHRHRNPLKRLVQELAASPIKLLEVGHHLLLGWVLLQTLFGFGGFLAYGKPMTGVSLSLFFLTALHLLIVTLRKEKKGIDWELLLPLPFLVYGWVSYRFISPAPWNAALFLTVYVQAYALYFLVYNSIRGTRSGLWIFSICQLVVVIALMGGFFQYYLFPEWMVTLERERNPAYLHGAAGFLMDPSHLASLLFLFWPVSVLIVWARRFSGPVRILNGFYAIAMLVGILVATHRPGLGIILAVLLILPFFLTRFWPVRRSLWIYGSLVMVACLPLFWFGTDTLQARMVYFMDPPADPLGAASIVTAWQQFLDQPLFGQGMGSFSFLWETARPEGFHGSSLYSSSSYAGILSELGLLGLLLLASPVVLLLARGYAFWAAIPFQTVSKDVQSRMARYPTNHPGRRQLERSHGRMPSAKLILSGLFLGFGAFLVHVAWDESLNFPVHLFVFACILAALAAISRSSRRRTVSSLVGIGTALVPLLLSSWSLGFGIPRFFAQYSVYTANEKLAYLLDDPDRIFVEPELLDGVIDSFETGSQFAPDHAGAWLGRGRAELARIHADIWPSQEIAGKAKEALGKSLELAPDFWLAHFEMGRVLAILEAEPDTIYGHLRQAIAASPARAEPVAFLGSLLLFRNPGSAEGRDLLAEALALDPGYEPAVKFHRRLGVAPERSDGRAVESARAGALSEALLAEQFDISTTGAERVLGAGVMPQPEEMLPAPE